MIGPPGGPGASALRPPHSGPVRATTPAASNATGGAKKWPAVQTGTNSSSNSHNQQQPNGPVSNHKPHIGGGAPPPPPPQTHKPQFGNQNNAQNGTGHVGYQNHNRSSYNTNSSGSTSNVSSNVGKLTEQFKHNNATSGPFGNKSTVPSAGRTRPPDLPTGPTSRPLPNTPTPPSPGYGARNSGAPPPPPVNKPPAVNSSTGVAPPPPLRRQSSSGSTTGRPLPPPPPPGGGPGRPGGNQVHYLMLLLLRNWTNPGL